MKTVSCFLTLSLLTAAATFAIDFADTRLLSQPAVSTQHVAFAYAGDLWIADRDGSNVRRLTSHPGDETSPRFSPDGSAIAFTGEYEGNADVYLVPVNGGLPKRLTWHPGLDLVQGFVPDGSAVLFASQRHMFTNRHFQLFTVSLDGGFPEQLPIPHGLRASLSPDGKKIAYIPTPERFQQWKNYRGGTTSRIWVVDLSSYEQVEVPQPEGRSNDTDPTWVGSMIWFRSDRNGEFNLFAYDSRSGSVEQKTTYDEFPVESVTGDGTSLIYEQAGYLHLFDPPTRQSRRLKIGVVDDLDETRPRWASGSRWIRSASLSPKGERAVFGYRGDIVTLPAKKGDIRNLTRTPGVHERFPVWSPDGSRVAYLTDVSGEYQLQIASQDGRGEPESFAVAGAGYYEEPQWSPDGSKISYVDNSWTLRVLDLESRAIDEVASEPHYGPTGFRALDQHSWSADSRWVAYSVNSPAYVSTVYVYDIEEKKSHQITDGLSNATEPVFDRKGDLLYFLASTDAGPQKHWFAMSNADMEVTSSVYVAVLRADAESPLAAQSDEVAVEKNADDQESDSGGEGDAGEDDESAEEGADRVTIDFDGIDQRILALPLERAAYRNLEAGKERQLFVLKGQGSSAALVHYDLAEREESEAMSGVAGFGMSADGSKLIYAAGQQQWGIATAGPKIDREKSSIPVDKLEVRIDPRAEWKQIFDEVWRINRDYFYDPNMHGADWEAMGEKYSFFLDHVTSRADLNRVLRWMCSEIAVGHHRVGGGDDPTSADRVRGGLLGADFEVANGSYRFAKVLGGLNWNPDLRAPLTEPGVSVSAGDYLLAVEGRPLSSSDNVYSFFENRADKITELEVGPNPDGSESRTVNVVPIASEAALRNRDWVEGNLKKVHDATEGRVAYVYVPNTAGAGHTYFKRYFFPQTDREAIIVDERFNGGGQVADYYIDHLRRPLISFWATRYGDTVVTPSAAILGPKVMVIDETAGSGGDLLPWMFNKLEMGTLIGKRTWGGLVGTLGFPVLIDGGFVTAPNLAIWTEDGFIVENVGVPPDIEVEQTVADVVAGRDPQLEKAIEVVLEQLEANPVRLPERPPYPIRVRR